MTLSNVSNVPAKLLPASSVSSIYDRVAAFCVVLFNLTLPCPGSAATVLESNV